MGDRQQSFDFSHYYTYTELVEFLQEFQQQYPNLMQLETIGTSYGGRDIWLATLTNQETGEDTDKPAFWIDANTHAGEVTGSAVALYIIYYLLTGYPQDQQAKRLLDYHTIYVLPRIAVDGAEKYLTTPYSLRSSIRSYPHQDKQDGLHPEDINGDGLILQMRIPDECGAWKVSPEDDRIMIPREPEEFGDRYYNIFTEGSIHNYDGYNITTAPSAEGLDFNRNYPHQWEPHGKQTGAGDFPFSEPETQAEAKFWQQHRNINGFITYHTFSAVFLRPYSTHSDEYFIPEDLEIYKLLGKRAKEYTGYDTVSVYHDFRYHPKEVTTGAMDDYVYDHFGWFGFTVELWDAPTAAGVEKKGYIEWFKYHPPEDEVKLMQWNDSQLEGKGFIPWQSFEHPQLGIVEIGGWNYKYVWQNAPSQYLEDICKKQCRWAIAHALLSPRLAISKTVVTPQGGDIYLIVLQLENQGFFPTYTSKKAQERNCVLPPEVSLILPDEAQLISGKLKQEISHLEGRSNKYYESTASGTDYLCSVEWVVKTPVNTEIEIIAKAQRAGTVSRKIKI